MHCLAAVVAAIAVDQVHFIFYPKFFTKVSRVCCCKVFILHVN